MFNRNVLALAGAALILAMSTVTSGTAHAQSGTGAPSAVQGATARTSATRAGGHPQAQAAAPAAPDAAANMAAAQAIATSAGITTCQITEATLLGDAPGGGKVYEAACATGPGYIFTGSTPPAAIDCVILADTLAKQAAAAPAAAAPARPARGARNAAPAVQPVGCKMPANLDTLGVMRGYATAAGVPCQVDAASPIGATSTGSIVYEIGCAGSDGYRIHQEAGAWTKSSCFLVVSSNATCRYTTPEEQNATLKAWLANSAAANCDVTQSRFMGANANGSFYEAKCAAGDGQIVRFDAAMAVQQLYPCATSALIGGGCKLTTVAAAPAASAPPAQR
ncbi:hypothetical protein BH10PSE2_BH10PSE2_27560 [soil metagenome]